MSDKPKRLNVLHIIADQHQAQCTGYEGHQQAITPNLDRLAVSGMRFPRAYTQNPICTPSRVSIFSGQYCHNHLYYGLIGRRPEALPSFFSHFKAHGYRTAGIGNMHTPNIPRNWLEGHLDSFQDTFQSADGIDEQTRWYDEIRAAGLLEKEDFHLVRCMGDHGMVGKCSLLPFEMSQEGWSVREAIRFIDGCAGEPFCMQVSLERPHTPCFPAREFWDMYGDDLAMPRTWGADISHRPPHFRNTFKWWREQRYNLPQDDFEKLARDLWHGYLGCITHVDHAVGLLLDHLDRTGLAGNTIVIYNADHGAYATAFGLLEKAPGICSDFVCRVPYIWRAPGVTPASGVCNQFAENVDIAPTIAALCALPPMPWADGKDLSGLLAGGDKPVREVAVTEHAHSKALRWKNWRFVHYQREMFDGQDIGELYDIEADPDESRNLYHDPQHAGVVAECRRRLMEWLIGTTRIRTVHARYVYDGYPDAGDGKLPRVIVPECINYV